MADRCACGREKVTCRVEWRRKGRYLLRDVEHCPRCVPVGDPRLVDLARTKGRPVRG